MKESLKENVQHGTPLYPIQLLKVYNYSGHLSVPYHWHEEIEILYIVKGTVTLIINGEKYYASPGELYIVNSEELHEIFSSDPKAYYYACIFPISHLSFETYDYSQGHYLTPLTKKKMFFSHSITPDTPHYSDICKEFTGLAQAFANHPHGYQLFMKASLLKIVSYLLQDQKIYSIQERPPKIDEYRAETLRAILTYIQENFSHKLSLDEISAHFNMSPKYFCRYFKDNFYKTFIEYLNEYRIKQAANLLLNTEHKIIDIAFLVGYDNLSYFIKKFKSITGYTPLQFKKAAPNSFIH